jgi:hypothetical protein
MDAQVEIIQLNLLVGEGLSNQDGSYLLSCLNESEINHCREVYLLLDKIEELTKRVKELEAFVV